MRKILVSFIAFGLTLSGVTFTPAHASMPPSGTYDCNTGTPTNSTPNYVITAGVVTNGANCVGDVLIAPGTTSILDTAFDDADLVTSISIPESVNRVEDCSFATAYELISIEVDSSNEFFQSIDGVLFDKPLNRLISYPPERNGHTYSVPADVVEIEDCAFYENQNLKNVTFETGSQLQRIGDRAFLYAYSLTSITFPSTVTTIEDSAFDSTASLASINIPAAVNSIGESAFAGDALTKITVDSKNRFFQSNDGVLFSRNGALFGNSIKTLIQYPRQKSSSLYSIPSGVTSIEASAFENALLIKSVIIPASVASIGDLAFSGAWELHSYFFLGRGPSIGDDAFESFLIKPKAFMKKGAKGFCNIGTVCKGLKMAKMPAIALTNPSISGVAEVNQSLALNKGKWVGYTTPKLSYTWYACTEEVLTPKTKVPKTCKKISGASKSKFKIKGAQKGKYIAVAVTGKVSGTTAKMVLTKSTAKVK